MATYLWIGQSHNTITPSTMVVDKYCWNTPGNWKVKQYINGVLQWTSTQSIPGGGDDAVIGGEANVSGITSISNLPGSSGELIGWEPAKCPLLFGGYTGGFGQGNWSHASATLIQGNTWTNSLNTLTISPNGYSHLNAVGGGISGAMLNYAVIKDSPFVFAGITSGYYNVSNSSGFRNPTENLRLKVRSLIKMNNWIFINSNIPDINTDEFDDYSEWDGTPGNMTDAFELSFDGVKAYTTWVGNTGNGSVETNVDVIAPHGGNIDILSGSYRTIKINQVTLKIRRDVAPFGYFPSIPGQPAVETRNIGQVNIRNCYAENIFAKKACYLNIGGTAASVSLSQWGYGVMQAKIWSNTTNHWVYMHQADAVVSCAFDSSAVLNDLYSTPPTDPYGGGRLVLTDEPIPMYVPAPTPTVPGSTIDIDRFDYTSFTNEYDRINALGLVFDYSDNITRTGDSSRGQLVSLQKFAGLTLETYNIPNIYMYSTQEYSPTSFEFKWQPWIVRFDGPAVATNITNRGGFIHSGPNLIPAEHTIRIGQIYLSRYGCIDFSKQKPSFDDWRIGGLTGSQGSSVLGGIISTDNTGIVRGSRDMKTYNSGGYLGGVDVRATSEKIYPYTPTSSTP